MSNFERQESGCPCRLCSEDGDRCALGDCKDVTGFEMCAVDWESCPEYQEILNFEKRMRELADNLEPTPEEKAATLAQLQKTIELFKGGEQ